VHRPQAPSTFINVLIAIHRVDAEFQQGGPILHPLRQRDGTGRLRQRAVAADESLNRFRVQDGLFASTRRDAFGQQPEAAWNLERQHRHPHQHRERRAEQSSELQW
jgi:hypothetical protein